MRKVIAILAGAALFAVAFGAGRMVAPAAEATAQTTGTTAEAATTVTTTTATTIERRRAPRRTAVDISGPCDEAEHANDPRCTGVAVGGASGSDDDSGRGRGSDDEPGDDHGRRGGGHGSDDGDDSGEDHGGRDHD